MKQKNKLATAVGAIGVISVLMFIASNVNANDNDRPGPGVDPVDFEVGIANLDKYPVKLRRATPSDLISSLSNEAAGLLGSTLRTRKSTGGDDTIYGYSVVKEAGWRTLLLGVDSDICAVHERYDGRLVSNCFTPELIEQGRAWTYVPETESSSGTVIGILPDDAGPLSVGGSNAVSLSGSGVYVMRTEGSDLLIRGVIEGEKKFSSHIPVERMESSISLLEVSND